MTLDEGLIVEGEPNVDHIALDEALRRLGALDPRKVQVVELRFFGGLSLDETAEVAPVPPLATTDGVHFDRRPTPEERVALVAYLRKL